MYKKTYSQKIARLFEIVNYLMASLAGVLILTSFIMFYVLWLVLIVWILAGAGLILAIRYINHSRGELDEEKVLGMWVGTIILNAVLLLPNLYILYKNFDPSNIYPSFNNGFALIWGFLMIWWASAIILSVTAIWSDERGSKIKQDLF